jgi:hypothetical protein
MSVSENKKNSQAFAQQPMKQPLKFQSHNMCLHNDLHESCMTDCSFQMYKLELPSERFQAGTFVFS